MNLDKFKAKLAAVKRREQELDIREQAIGILFPIGKKLASRVQGKVANNNVLLLEKIVTAINDQTDNIDVIEALTEQTKELKEGTSKKVISCIEELYKNVAKLESKKYFSQEEFDHVFNTGIEKIVNVLVSQEELPNETDYFYNSQNKIIKVVEKYDDFTVTNNWIYNQKGKLSKVKTVKNEIT